MIDLSEAAILAARSPRMSPEVTRPVAYFVEPECSAARRVEDVATIFLANRECPFHCLMCDLWQHTTEQTVPVGAIPQQIAGALSQMSAARHLKLYNSGNFFDTKAIPPEDHPAIAELCRGFDSVIVENHPRLTGPRCLAFRDQLAAIGVQLEIALGLETIHPEVLPKLNKQMTSDDFAAAASFLQREGIRSRAFVLLKPPFLNESEGVEWALKSMRFAFDVGVDCCAVIPTRAGNGIMEQLGAAGLYSPPHLTSLEQVLEAGLQWQAGRVFVDLWDARRFATCSHCVDERLARLQCMNLSQQVIEARSACEFCISDGAL